VTYPRSPVEDVIVTEDRITRFADYSNEELSGLLAELERGDDNRLLGLIAEIKAELERRRGLAGE
jgi:hypothetical protein